MDSGRADGREALASIAGEWITSGHVVGPQPTAVNGTDTYEVLPGGYFLVHHVDVTVGSKPVITIEIIGEPAPQGGYWARSFDNEGNVEVMHVTVDEDGIFHFAGGPDVAPAAKSKDTRAERVRSTLRVAEDRRSMTAEWERSEDGKTWVPWMHIAFTRKR